MPPKKKTVAKKARTEPRTVAKKTKAKTKTKADLMREVNREMKNAPKGLSAHDKKLYALQRLNGRGWFNDFVGGFKKGLTTVLDIGGPIVNAFVPGVGPVAGAISNVFK